MPSIVMSVFGVSRAAAEFGKQPIPNTREKPIEQINRLKLLVIGTPYAHNCSLNVNSPHLVPNQEAGSRREDR
jgi:hypothetical protein